MKSIEQYFPVVLFIMLYKVVLTSESVDEILQCDRATEQYFPASLFVFTFFNGIQSGPHTYISVNELCEVSVPDIKHIRPFEHRNSALINLPTQNTMPGSNTKHL